MTIAKWHNVTPSSNVLELALNAPIGRLQTRLGCNPGSFGAISAWARVVGLSARTSEGEYER